MRPFDDIRFEEGDYSEVALLVASVREWPREEFARELDARVARRFAPELSPRASRPDRGPRRSLRRWVAGPAVALVAGAVAAVIVISGAGGGGLNGPARFDALTTKVSTHSPSNRSSANNATVTYNSPGASGSATGGSGGSGGASGAVTAGSGYGAEQPSASTPVKAAALPAAGPSTFTTAGAPASTLNTNAAASGTAPVAPGGRQIQSAQISLTAPNQYVEQVAHEVYGVVGAEHGIVESSHVVSATRSAGGGYASFSLSIPSDNLQDAMTQLSRMHYASVSSRDDGSQNVSGRYNRDQRQLADAKALRASLLKQLQSAYTQSAIDSIKAQLKLAEQQISSAQATLGALQHRISYSTVTVQINSGGLPVGPAHSSSFTIGRAGHDALRVLVVAAGVALIALAVMIPLGLVAALLVWLWVWLRQRRREHALDAAG